MVQHKTRGAYNVIEVNGQCFYEKITNNSVETSAETKEKTYLEATVAKMKTKTEKKIAIPAPAPKAPGAQASFGLDAGAACKLSEAAEEQAVSCNTVIHVHVPVYMEPGSALCFCAVASPHVQTLAGLIVEAQEASDLFDPAWLAG